MIRVLTALLLLASLLGAPSFAPCAGATEGGQDAGPAALYSKCDTQIPWLSDGVVLPDCESLGHRRGPTTQKPADLIEAAKKKAAAEKKLILWYIPRQPGQHMNRATILDQYIRVSLFTDPDVVGEINRCFVPLRCCLTKTVAEQFQLAKWDFIEPGFAFLTPTGEKVHVVDRLRTINAEWTLELFRQVLAKQPTFAPKPPPAPSNDYERAVEARRHRDGAAALKFLETVKLPEAAVEKGRVLMHQGKYEEARAILEKAAGEKSARQSEALYWLAHLDRYTGHAELSRGRWEKLVKDFPGQTWAWRAASHFAVREDTLPMGPVLHNFEDVAWPPAGALASLPKTTRWGRTDADEDDVVKRAVEWLLLHQDATGAWSDSRYVYCDSPKILPNVFVAITSLACSALRDWRDVDPARVDAAIARGEKFLLDEKIMSRRENEEMYADAYKLYYLAGKQAGLDEKAKAAGVAQMNKVAAALAKTQGKDGFWAHEYPNSFCTAAVMQCLFAAKKAGAAIDERMLKQGIRALEEGRSEDGRQPYSAGRPASSPKDSSARNAVCESALFQGGVSKPERVATALDGFLEYLPRQEAIRVCDYHADDELGAFMFFHGFFHATLATCDLDAATAGPYREKLRTHLLTMPEFDGSFLDSHELGKSYGTAMALLSLKITAKPKGK